MTVFLTIIKLFVISDVKAMRDKAIKADSSVVNKSLQWLGYGRDAQLSQEKINIADDLWTEINKFEGESCDFINYSTLKQKIASAKKIAKEASEKKHYSEANFGEASEGILEFIDDVYEKLEKAKFLNIKYDDDPFHILCYYAAYYLIQKIYDARVASTTDYYLKHPKVSKLKELSKIKEELIINCVQTCEHNLSRLNTKLSDYQETRKVFVKDAIKKLIGENSEECKNHGISWVLPVQIVIFATINVGLPTMSPDSGFLERCMDEALKMIDKKTKSLDAPCSSNAGNNESDNAQNASDNNAVDEEASPEVEDSATTLSM